MGTAVADTAASYTPPLTHFSHIPERKTYPRTTARGGSKERESGHGQTQRHHTLNREDPTRAQQRVAAERGRRAGTAVPDTAASYTRPRRRGGGTGVPDSTPRNPLAT